MTASDEPWGGTGVGRLLLFKLKNDDKEALALALQRSVSSPEATAFMQAMRVAIGVYHVAKDIAARSTPSATRADMLAIRAIGLKAHKVLNATGGNTRQILGESDDDYQVLHALAARFTAAGDKGLEAASRYPTAGALVDHPAQQLAQAVARAMEEHCGIKTTGTRGSKYEAVLEIIMTMATGKEPKALHALMRRALAAERRDAEGPKTI